MANAQLRYQGPADAKRTPAPDFKVGDQVYVKAKYFRSTRPSRKLSEKNLGPYTIIAQVGSLSFTLRLPDSMRAVHPIFHVSQLEPAIPNTIPDRIQPPLPPVEVDGEPEFEISERSLTPKLIVDADRASYCTWCVGPVTKELTKKLHGFSPLNLATQWNS